MASLYRLSEAESSDMQGSFSSAFLEKLARKSHYCFLDGFFGYMQIHIALVDQHKTTFTCPFGTFTYNRMPFCLCNALSTFQRCMISIFLDLLEGCMEVLMGDFTEYAESFEACLENLSRVLTRCIETNLVLNFEKCHFMVTEEIVLGHLSSRGIEVDKAKVDIITSLPNPAFVQEVCSFLGHADCPALVQAALERCGLRLRPALHGGFPGAKEAICDTSNLTLRAILGQRVGNVEFSIKEAGCKTKMIRWMLLLPEFDLEIRDKKGVENAIVDHLS
ncbi:Retrovirus-related Pol polyprotein from transposon 17.6, partial [Mucuna pruriens]